MTDPKQSHGYKLPVNPEKKQGTIAQGFATPKQDRVPQVLAIPSKRVLPIVFIPGIMGSNLRMRADRQATLGEKSNIAWRPDNAAVTIPQYNDTPTERQLRLDPETTEVDIYVADGKPAWSDGETADKRNEEVSVTFTYGMDRLNGPLLQSDLPGTVGAKTKDQKARERGWGEVYFSSYYHILASCETSMNTAFVGGILDRYLAKHIVGISPSKWQAHSSPAIGVLDEKTVRDAVKDCWFPVHAMGYNWLKGNMDSGVAIASRIELLIANYQQQGFQCEKVILVTHSMGGLVARAIIHPKMGNLNDKVLGVIHGVMPAMGAAAAYKRVRCGFEGSGPAAKVCGHIGSNVTPVLGNAQGGLELLPSQAYGNNWLQVKHKGATLKSLPVKGDPYEEIYKLNGKWFGLLNQDWINPARLLGRGYKNTCMLLDRAKSFHNAIENTYHDESYAHYGADPKRAAWHKVVWEIDNNASLSDVDFLTIKEDDEKGNMRVIDPTRRTNPTVPAELFSIALLDPVDAGDQTVPLHSAEAQLRSGKFKAIFRQSGYEHQASYSDKAVISATLYSLFRIASTMKWSK